MSQNTTTITTSNMAEVSSAKNVVALVKKAAQAYSKAPKLVQNAGVAIIIHASLYGDCSQAKVLARAVPARERNSLIGWFSLYSPIGIQMGKTTADDKCRFIKRESKRYHDFNIDGAKANMWWDDPAKVNPEPRPLNTLLDFYQTIDRLLKKAIKDAQADDKYDEQYRDDVKRQADDIMAMVNKYRAKNLAPQMLAKMSEYPNVASDSWADDKVAAA